MNEKNREEAIVKRNSNGEGKKGIKNREREKRDRTVETTRGGWEVTSRDRSFVKFKYYCR